MCNDRPGDLLYDTIRKNTIKNNPFKESIIGTVDEVNSIPWCYAHHLWEAKNISYKE